MQGCLSPGHPACTLVCCSNYDLGALLCTLWPSETGYRAWLLGFITHVLLQQHNLTPNLTPNLTHLEG